MVRSVAMQDVQASPDDRDPPLEQVGVARLSSSSIALLDRALATPHKVGTSTFSAPVMLGDHHGGVIMRTVFRTLRDLLSTATQVAVKLCYRFASMRPT